MADLGTKHADHQELIEVAAECSLAILARLAQAAIKVTLTALIVRPWIRSTTI